MEVNFERPGLERSPALRGREDKPKGLRACRGAQDQHADDHKPEAQTLQATALRVLAASTPKRLEQPPRRAQRPTAVNK